MNLVAAILICALRLYRWVLSPAKAAFFGPLGRCRYSPSCSEYALGAIQSHGACAGSWLALRRILRCHRWGDCGHDPVPPPVRCAIPAPQIHHLKLSLPQADKPSRARAELSGLRG